MTWVEFFDKLVREHFVGVCVTIVLAMPNNFVNLTVKRITRGSKGA